MTDILDEFMDLDDCQFSFEELVSRKYIPQTAKGNGKQKVHLTSVHSAPLDTCDMIIAARQNSQWLLRLGMIEDCIYARSAQAETFKQFVRVKHGSRSIQRVWRCWEKTRANGEDFETSKSILWSQSSIKPPNPGNSCHGILAFECLTDACSANVRKNSETKRGNSKVKHVVPLATTFKPTTSFRSHEVETTLQNGQALCASCNKKKGNKMPEMIFVNGKAAHNKCIDWFNDSADQKHFVINAAPEGKQSVHRLSPKACCAWARLNEWLSLLREQVVRQWSDEFFAVTQRHMTKVTGRRANWRFWEICATWSAIWNACRWLQYAERTRPSSFVMSITTPQCKLPGVRLIQHSKRRAMFLCWPNAS